MEDIELDVAGTLAELAEVRPIFRHERDFQRAVARQVRLRHPQATVGLEAPSRPGNHLDVLIGLRNRRTAIELKYLRTRFRGTVAGESYELAHHAAHNTRRHDVIQDVTRVETLLSAGYADEGYVVVLTNDRNYWLPSARADTNGDAFRIHEGRQFEGTLKWASRAAPGTTRNRDVPLVLAGRYECRWRDYSSVRDDRGKVAKLRYLLLAVHP
jgi:hypothetical protein